MRSGSGACQGRNQRSLSKDIGLGLCASAHGQRVLPAAGPHVQRQHGVARHRCGLQVPLLQRAQQLLRAGPARQSAKGDAYVVVRNRCLCPFSDHTMTQRIH